MLQRERSKFHAVRKTWAMPLTSIDFPFVNKTISDKHPFCDDRQYTGIGPDREQRHDCGNPNASTLQPRRRADGDVRPLVVCRRR
jgi:hypothetical protein